MKKKKIVVIDDDTAILDAVKTVLEDAAYEVVVFASTQQLIENIIAQQPNLILLDVTLIDADGRDIAKKIKKTAETKNIPIILLSAHSDLEKIAKKIMWDAFIEKPFDIASLLKKVKKYSSSHLPVKNA